MKAGPMNKEQEAAWAIAMVEKGEPVGVINAQGGVLLTDLGAIWFKAKIAEASKDVPGQPALMLYGRP